MKTTDILNALGVKPYEQFLIEFEETKKNKPVLFYIDERLKICCVGHKLENYNIYLGDILNGTAKIVKLPKITKSERIALLGLKEMGYKYISLGNDGIVYAVAKREDPLCYIYNSELFKNTFNNEDIFYIDDLLLEEA